ncbi:MAG: stage V sporulation protein D, partial [Acetanaerobacterium sp.]
MIKKMLFIVVVMTAVCFSVLIGRLAYLQLVANEPYQQKAIGQQMRETTVKAQRGTIYDCNLNVLAQSASVWEVTLNPINIKDEQRTLIAKTLAEILDVDEQRVLEKTEKKNYYELVKRRVESPEADAIRKFISDNSITGIVLNEDFKRYY